MSEIRKAYPNAQIWYRWSVATGVKYSTQWPFDPTDFDVDAFVVDDDLAKWINATTWFRDITTVNNIKIVSQVDWIESKLINNLDWYRTEPWKEFTFRVYTQNEFEKKVKSNWYKLIK